MLKHNRLHWPILLLLILNWIKPDIYCQDSITKPRFELNGYVSAIASLITTGNTPDGAWDGLLHNRLNLNWYPSDNIRATIQFRNRLMAGESFDLYPKYAASYDKDKGFADLSFNLFSGDRYLLNTQIDRFYVQWTLGKLDITAGRQRINWSQTFVWNPNDIFNNYSFFDFDYEEKPGADAIRLQYYLGAASSVEAAVKIDSGKLITAAGLIRFNKAGIDFQMLGGILNSKDLSLGAGWSSSIGSAAIRGEIGYFHPLDNFQDTSALWSVSIGLDRTFGNSLMFQSEILYMKVPGGVNETSFLSFYSAPISVKNLSFTRWNLFSQVSYPFTPLLNTSLSAMYFPDISGFYLGPSLSYSLMQRLGSMLVLQVFSGELPYSQGGKTQRQTLYLGFLRFKYSF